MNWLKENWFKLGIFLAVLAIAVSACYYFIFYLPKHRESSLSTQRREMAKKNNEQCAKQGKEFTKDFMAKYWDGVEPIGNSFYFNDRLNTCLVSIDVFNNNARSVIHSTFDIYTNEELLASTVLLKPNEEKHTNDRVYFGGLQEDEYWQKQKELMNNGIE